MGVGLGAALFPAFQLGKQLPVVAFDGDYARPLRLKRQRVISYDKDAIRVGVAGFRCAATLPFGIKVGQIGR